ncbi:MAG: NAD(P)H-dependent glycerol-3-phosphate dehydrogenase [Bacteroidetes bacterium]|nr:NAD(P)H-dependent glycerol-3-phosphate dehydrogenase [Bacteroidota bacterium]MCH8523666.1 NAD(P)H-dependent glycerol-3-phosphate dehydrogenase [Balneolales bacterium]
MKVSVIGAGSWGTALSVVLQSNGHDVLLWAREPEIVSAINTIHRNPTYLPDLVLPGSVRATSTFEDTFAGRDMIVFATPSHTMREVAQRARNQLNGTEIIVTVSKGIEKDTFMSMTQVLTEVLKDVISEDHIGTLSGPSHAEEVARGKPTVVVSAANSRTTSRLVQEAFMTPMFRVYVNHDVIGVEVAGAVKNIMAIAAGIVDGADLGDNAKAALLTRGLLEIKRLGTRLGASQDTFSGLAGVGDLIVTCTSEHSRNRYVGYHIGKGEKLNDIRQRMSMIAEGVKTTRSVYEWSQHLGIEMPITEMVYKVLFEEKNPMEAMYELMTRESKEEILI